MLTGASRTNACTPIGDAEAERAAARRDDERLDEQLAEEPRPARAERGADAHLAGALERPREHQVGDVRAGDQEHQRHRGQKQHERPARPADEPVVERTQPRAHLRVGLRVHLLQVARHPDQILARLRQRHPGLETRDGAEVVGTPHFPHLREVHRPRHPEVGLRAVEREVRRHDADDLEIEAVQRQRAIDDVRVGAELTAPESIAQHEHAMTSDDVLAGRERAAGRGAHAEYVEEVRGDEQALHAHGLVAAEREARESGVARRGSEVDGDVRERSVPLAPAQQVAGRDAGFGPVEQRVHFPELNEGRRVAVRERLQQHGVHDAEDRGGRAGAERQRENRRACEAGPPAKLADPVPQVGGDERRAPAIPAKPERVERRPDSEPQRAARRAGLQLAEPLAPPLGALVGGDDPRRGSNQPGRQAHPQLLARAGRARRA
jgi:hypothetical protein